MGRLEVDELTLRAHALNEGISDTMLEGSLKFDSGAEGIAVVLQLKTVGSRTVMTDALRDMVVRALRSKSFVIEHDGEEVRPDVEKDGLLWRASPGRKLPSLKRLPYGSPRLMAEHES